MINVGHINANFEAKANGLDVYFDPTLNEQFLTFKFTLTASLPQLLQQLLNFQQSSEKQSAGQAQMPPMLMQYGQQGSALQPVTLPYMQTQAAAAMVAPPPQLQQQMMQQLVPPHSQQQQMQLPQQQLQPPRSQTRVQALPVDGAPQRPQMSQPSHQQPPTSQPHPQPPASSPLPQPLPMAPLAPAQPVPSVSVCNPQLNAAFMEALTADNLQQARQLLNQKADVNFVEAGPGKRTPLFHVLEAGGKVDHMNLLLKAKANVSAVMSRGKTALHVAIQQYLNLPPLVIRMLLCHRADLHTRDERGMTPLDCVRIIHMQCAQGQQQDPQMRVRQLLNEVTEQPTVDIVIPADGQNIQSAFFADVHNDKVVFNTDSSIGLYSLVHKRLIFFKKLKQQVASSVKNIAVNPEFGTIAVCIELMDVQGDAVVGRQNVFIVWPNGQLLDEEPLKLSIKIEASNRTHFQPACVMLSHCQGPQMLLGRLVDGKIFCWHMNSARSQLVSEYELVKNGGRLAISDNGHWIAVCRNDAEPPGKLSIFTYESPDGGSVNSKRPTEVVTLEKNPQALAIQHTASSATASCFIALSEAPGPDGALPPIEVIALSADGTHSTLYRLKCPSLCHTLSFCHRTATYLLSAHKDGLILLNDLLNGTNNMSHDNPGIGFVSICTDRSLIVSTEDNYIRVFKVTAAA